MGKRSATLYRKALITLLLQRDGPYCAFCGGLIEVESASVDHIVEVSRGGNDDVSNLRALHLSCNSRCARLGQRQTAECHAKRSASLKAYWAKLSEADRRARNVAKGRRLSAAARLRMSDAQFRYWASEAGQVARKERNWSGWHNVQSVN